VGRFGQRLIVSASGRRDGGDADQRGLHLAVAAATEFGARDLIAAGRRRGELHRHRVARLRVCTALGDRDQAMTWLEEGYEERFNPGVLLRPGFDPLRSDPRFQALARRVGLNK
jgi:hypothetical protein